MKKDFPVEYITGKVTFFGRDFIVTPDVLIPRLETESLVRRARQSLQGTMINDQGTIGTKQGTIVVDIGAGSGIIGTSLADLADEVIFIDISPAALKIAQQNFYTHFPDKKAQFIVSDLLFALNPPPEKGELEGVTQKGVHNNVTPPSLPFSWEEGNILFLTNLPYIKNEDWENMSADTVHEPRLALFGGEKTGFELYERLFEEFSVLFPSLLGGGLGVRCLFEFGFDQRGIAEKMLRKYPDWKYEFFRDYAGVERFGEIQVNQQFP